ncbi:hypothetical protein ACQJBY_026121 [Aegilops geniculata]
MLSHAARLELIRSVFSAIPVYYMSNILFSKKFIAKLTAVIRNFWWTRIRETDSRKSLCLRAWKDISNSKTEGGLGIRNLKAINESLILAAAWRLAINPTSHLYSVLRAKYFPNTTIWKATLAPPKSAFWAAILKMFPKIKNHAFYQLTQGNISLWSMPWCTNWNTIHDYLIPQHSAFVYPSLVKDLWMTEARSWNHQLIRQLFREPLAYQIINTNIIQDDNEDLLCWPLAPNGTCSPKHAYKICLQDIHAHPRTAPTQVATDLKNFLKVLWKNNSMLPKIKTFAWRLLSKALPTGTRAGKFSSHISQICSRCAHHEDDFHLFFPLSLC